MPEESKDNALQIFQEDTHRIMNFVMQLVGDKNAVKPIQDDKTMQSVIENKDGIKRLKEAIITHFKPLKAAKKAIWQAEVDEEKKFLDPIERVGNFVDARLNDYFDKLRTERAERERKEAEERAERQRKELLEQAQSAENAGNKELKVTFEEAATGIMPEIVSECDFKVKARAVTGTMSESDTIEAFKIISQIDAIKALIEMGLGGILTLDSKTETAIKKYIISNPSVKSINGIEFRRGFKAIYRSRTAEGGSGQ